MPSTKLRFENLSCPHLGSKGCQVYAERPLICRLFGTTPRLACPNGNGPEVMVDPDIDRRIQRFFVETRHVLV
ncbi:YkgJ family cysteine cluster protein [Cupriavidus basilensis]